MGELGEISEHHGRIGTGVILVAQFLQGAGKIGAHQRVEKIDHPRAVGEPQHLPDVGGPHACGACWPGVRHCLVKQ